MLKRTLRQRAEVFPYIIRVLVKGQDCIRPHQKHCIGEVSSSWLGAVDECLVRVLDHQVIKLHVCRVRSFFTQMNDGDAESTCESTLPFYDCPPFGYALCGLLLWAGCVDWPIAGALPAVCRSKQFTISRRVEPESRSVSSHKPTQDSGHGPLCHHHSRGQSLPSLLSLRIWSWRKETLQIHAQGSKIIGTLIRPT
jgi:hypothetical protein